MLYNIWDFCKLFFTGALLFAAVVGFSAGIAWILVNYSAALIPILAVPVCVYFGVIFREIRKELGR